MLLRCSFTKLNIKRVGAAPQGRLGGGGGSPPTQLYEVIFINRPKMWGKNWGDGGMMSPTTLVLLVTSIFQKGLSFYHFFAYYVDSYYNYITLCLLENSYFVFI